MDRGFLKLWRKSADSEVFACPHLWRLWTWCLMQASYKARVVPVRTGKGSTIVKLLPGEFIFGRNSAALNLSESPSTIRNRVKKLEDMGMIKVRADSQYSIITICNWDLYQSEEEGKGQSKDSKRTAKGQQKDNQVTTEEQPEDTNKKVNKEKNVKNSSQGVPADFLVTEEMKEWVADKTKFQGDVETETEKFLDHFLANGERKKDWEATWRNWMRRAGEWNSYQQGGIRPQPSTTIPNVTPTGKRILM